MANVGVAQGFVDLYVVHKTFVPEKPDEFPYVVEYINVGESRNQGKQAKARNAKLKNHEKANRKRVSSGLSDDEVLNSDELEELSSE
ncbi:hypothetical protein PIB30_044504 [Stylosanthes scabra]|uniref:Uncharacterized protein n=1 Tax=Stylosanthes scabra TaxID=79078 RepID=A0ABU6ZEK5_9FABA|nr:hypothetical protein [Stylosanthes scabra]